MKDNHGDQIRIFVEEYEGGTIYLDCRDSERELLDMALTPAKARKLAKKLKRAAKEAERA